MFTDFLLEDDNDKQKQSMFAKAKSIALRFAKSVNRSTDGIKKAQNGGELKDSIHSWKFSKDNKAKTAYNNIDKTLKSGYKSDDTDDVKDKETEDTENTENKNTENVNDTENKTDTEKEAEEKIKDNAQFLKPDEAQEYEYAVRNTENDMQRISKKLIDNAELKKKRTESFIELLEILLKALSGDESISLDGVIDNAERRIEFANSINDSIDSLNDYKDTITNDYKDKIEAQDTILRDREKELEHEVSPEIADYEKERVKKYDEKFKQLIANDSELRALNDEYEYFSTKKPLTNDEMLRKREIEDGRYGEMLKALNDEFKPMSDAEKERINKKYREDKLEKTKKRVELNKNLLKAEYEKMMNEFETNSKEFKKELLRMRKNITNDKKLKGGISQIKLDRFKKTSENFSDYMSTLNKEINVKLKDENDEDEES